MRTRAPNVAKWVMRMQHPDKFDGDFLQNDQVPETLFPLLRRMFAEQLPVLLDTIRRVGKWKEEHPDAKGIPRFLGKHEFVLGEVSATRYVMPYAQWMFQRPMTFYQSLGDEQKAKIDPLLQQLGGLEGLNEVVVAPLKFEDHRIRFEM